MGIFFKEAFPSSYGKLLNLGKKFSIFCGFPLITNDYFACQN